MIYTGKAIEFSMSGKSHGERISGVLRGIPDGITVDEESLREYMSRRKSDGRLSTKRIEPDEVIFTRGITDGKTDGGDISFYIENKDVKKSDYSALKNVFRPSHADYGAYLKYGADYDMSGGGEFSGRLTALICVAGFICRETLGECRITSSLYSVGKTKITDATDINSVISDIMKDGDSVGGVIECRISGYPTGIGGAYFDGLEGRLSSAIFAIPAVKGIEFGAGFASGIMRGSEFNDEMQIGKDGCVEFLSENNGGILGGISVGDITLRVAFKPTPSISLPQRTVRLKDGKPENYILTIPGRHDCCIALRAGVIVESAVALVLADELLKEKNEKS